MDFRLFYVIVLTVFFFVCGTICDKTDSKILLKFKKSLNNSYINSNIKIVNEVTSMVTNYEKLNEEELDLIKLDKIKLRKISNGTKNISNYKIDDILMMGIDNYDKDLLIEPEGFLGSTETNEGKPENYELKEVLKKEPKANKLPSFLRDLTKIQSNSKDIKNDPRKNFLYNKNIITDSTLPKQHLFYPNINNYNKRESKFKENMAEGLLMPKTKVMEAKRTEKKKKNIYRKTKEILPLTQDEDNKGVQQKDKLQQKRKFSRIKKSRRQPLSPKTLAKEEIKPIKIFKSERLKHYENYSKLKKRFGNVRREILINVNASTITSKSRQERAVMPRKERIWDYGVIPYEIDNIFSGNHKAIFKQAMRHWENYTCIKFVERDPAYHNNYIYFTIKNCGCCSFVGKRGNGRQAISIGTNCDKFGIVVHELGHVIGFWHEHTRIDRDQYIQINRANILQGQEYNFNVLDPEDVDSLGLPYDYNSIMHYARNTFSKSIYLDTITPIIPKGQQRPEIGQRIRLSQGANRVINGTLNNDDMIERCEWRITATHGESITLRIRELQIFTNDTAGNCKDNFLEIRDGYWLKSPLIARTCGNKIDKRLAGGIRSKSSRMLITYVNSMLPKGFKGFIAEFEVTCGGTFYINDSQRIDSPNYPSEYLPDKECIWRIIVPDKYEVALQFQTFEIENHDNCIYDYVEIRDGNTADSELIGVFCGHKIPPTIKTNSNEMYVKFISDSTVQKVGFSGIFMKEVDECKLRKHDCQHECVNTLGSYECICKAGYELELDGKSCGDACGGRINASMKSKLKLASPSFPHVYPILKNCIWEIVAEENHNVFLNFTHFDMEGSKYQFKECSYDYLNIYSKLKDNRLRLIGTFCGTELPPLIQSENNILRVEFHSDKSIQHTGFLAEIKTDYDECAKGNGKCQHNCINTYGSYKCSCRIGYSLHENGFNCSETNCKFEVTSSYGVVHSPNYPNNYPKNLYCYWHFSTVPGHRILLSFHDFEIENHQECIYDSLTLYDGKNENSSTLGSYCGEKQPYTVVASTNELYMVLKTDSGLQKKGFMATHTIECGGYLRATNETKHFYSHAKFGHRPYKKNVYCVWRIQANSESSVKLSFVSFSIEYEGKCGYDYVEVSEDSNQSRKSSHGKFCGNFKPPKITSHSDSLIVKFETDNSTSLKGFAASYVAVEPPGGQDTEYEKNTSYS
ncbi:dorsal-ventral patterning protein tolloid isoform X2 [Condylostylus longicornis]|uniref:dorsal-ventral patterning protein tolloid isoform X2 n=1 Tax=Condylostylus longicornis TaxID=2530218 RepID=UPI00244DE3F1|nr:dorsal-ventral patterning protein tolloid isoform X2 [Condylostylus longicornis]